MNLYRLIMLVFLCASTLGVVNINYLVAHGIEKHQKQSDTNIEHSEENENKDTPGITRADRWSKFLTFIEINLPVYLGISALTSLLITFSIGFLGHRRIIIFNIKHHKIFAYLTVALALSHGIWMLIEHF